jgi:hypothetical protein
MLFSVLDVRARQYEVYTVSEYQQSNAIAKYHYTMKSPPSPTHNAHPAVATDCGLCELFLCELFLCELLRVTVSCPRTWQDLKRWLDSAILRTSPIDEILGTAPSTNQKQLKCCKSLFIDQQTWILVLLHSLRPISSRSLENLTIIAFPHTNL